MTRTKRLQLLLASPLLLLAVSVNAYAASGIAVSSNKVTLTAAPGGASQSRTINVTSTSPGEEYYVDRFGGSWLAVVEDGGTTPGTFQIVVFPPSNAGTYSGDVRVTALSDFATQWVNVVLTVGDGGNNGGGNGGGNNGGGNGGAVTANPSSLTFQYVSGSAAPAAKTINLSTGSGTSAFTAAANAAWLSVSPASGDAPSTLTVTANPAGLDIGTYESSITIGANGSTFTVSMTLIVLASGGTGGSITASPSSMSFSQIFGGAVPAPQTLNVEKPGGSATFTATANKPWLIVAPGNGVTPSALQVSIDSTGLPPGSYSGTITLNAGTSAISVPVGLSITSPSGESFTITPSSLTFEQKLGGPAPAPQVLALRTTTPGLPYTAVFNDGWLRALPSTGLTQADLEVSVNASLLAPKSYTSSIVVTIGTTKITVPVTFNVTESVTTATVSPTALSFAYTVGGLNPDAQKIHFENPNPGKAFTATATSTKNWLRVTPGTGTAPSDLSVSVNPSGLATGTYDDGKVTIVSGSTTLTVTVTLVVSKVTLSSSVQPSILGFNGSVGGSPAPQLVAVASSGTPFTFSAKPTTANQVNWLRVTPDSGTTPSSVAVSVVTTGLPAGQYTGTIAVTPTDPAISASTISVTLTLSPAGPGGPTPVIRSVVNGASLKAGNIAPGEIIIIKGSNLGPEIGIGPEVLPAGAITSSGNGTRVLFDGNPAPLMYVQSGQVTTIVPYAMFGRFSTNMQVEYLGVKSDPLTLMIDGTSPAIFTGDNSGSGQALVTNEDGSTNSNLRAAPRGSVITVWGTGEGQTNPSGQDGRIIATDLRNPLAQVSAKIGGIPAEVRYAGSASGAVSGYFQVNIFVPMEVAAGSNVPLEITVGGVKSQANVSVAVK